jgi:hypothetical protein
MTPVIRISSRRAARFKNGGLEVVKGNWTTVKELDAKQRATLVEFHGRFIQVHPDDVAKLKHHGLAFVDADSPLADLKAPPKTEPAKGAAPAGKPSTTPTASTKTEPAKGAAPAGKPSTTPTASTKTEPAKGAAPATTGTTKE